MIVEDSLPFIAPVAVAETDSRRFSMAKRALSWKRAGAIGWRDLKSAPGKFGFVVLSVAVGVAALVGVRGSARASGGLWARKQSR